MAVKKTVSLVLGSGGARGFAHIGVINELTRCGYEIKAITGSSMGALIGGIYGTGKLDVYTRWVMALQRTDVIRLLDLSFGHNGLIKGDRIMEVLRELIGDINIEDLPIRFAAVATDMVAEEEAWFREGPLFDAIRASISIPTIFTPHQYRGREFLDGGLINPLPITGALKDKADLTIAVILSGKPTPKPKLQVPPPQNNNHQHATYHQRIMQFVEELMIRMERQSDETLSMLDIIMKSMVIMENTLALAQLKDHAPDILIEIPRNACNFYEFHRARELIEIGRLQTVAALSSKTRAE
ncbi:MAG: patatin-like phospholipase family protein [Gammaproteobacteria bacterium]|nr:patatin-like phospholipase family protein [Gammaproteobacteria bacterium]